MRVVMLGLGNILLRDEGVGVRVIEALAERYVLPPEVEAVDGGTAGMELLNLIAGCDHLIICDAVKEDSPPGTVMKLVDAEIPTFFQTRYSPHQLGLADVLATLALTDEAPRVVTLIGVVPFDLELGLELSPEVEAAVGKAVEEVVGVLRAVGCELVLRRLVRDG